MFAKFRKLLEEFEERFLDILKEVEAVEAVEEVAVEEVLEMNDDDTLPSELGEPDWSDAEDEDASVFSPPTVWELGSCYKVRPSPVTLEKNLANLQTITTKWPISRWEYHPHEVLAEMAGHYSSESYRKRVTQMWQLAKHRELTCAPVLEQAKRLANQGTIQCLQRGENPGLKTKEYYREMQHLISRTETPLDNLSLFLTGLPARRVADIEAMVVVEGGPGGDATRNYLVRDPIHIENSRVVFRVQKTKKPSDYTLRELNFLINYDKILEIVAKLPLGPFVTGNYYTKVVHQTGFTPTDFRHLAMNRARQTYQWSQLQFFIRCMNSGNGQMAIYCS